MMIALTGCADMTEEIAVLPGISFSEEAYFYSESIEVLINSDKPGKIYYTTDGTEPDEEQNLYSGAIRLEASDSVHATCLRAKAFYEDGSESDPIIHTYFVGREISTRFDTLIFSVTTDPYNLYDYEYGIFVTGKLRDEYIAKHPGVTVKVTDPANYNIRGRAAEREVYLEVLEPNGLQVIAQTAGIRTYGGYSRAKEQKSIRLFARKDYDAVNNKFRYNFFPWKTSSDGEGDFSDNFDQLVLRNCGNDNGYGFIRDELLQTLAGYAGYQDYEAVRPAALFINGDYRGFFWLHEVYSDEYFEGHYGKYDGDFVILEGGETFKKIDIGKDDIEEVKEYEEMYYRYAYKDLTNDEEYNNLCKLIDVENYLDYYALQIYIGNEDWPYNNYKTYRYYVTEGEEYREEPFDGRWRFLLHDLDTSFGLHGAVATKDTIKNFVGKEGEIMEACPLFSRLMQREDCREIFIKKTLELINGAFSTKNLNPVLNEMNRARLNELKNTYGKGLLNAGINVTDMEEELRVMKAYGEARAEYVLNQYKEYFDLGEIYHITVKGPEGCKIKVNSYVSAEDFEGNFYTAYDTELTAILPKGKKVIYWLVNGEKLKMNQLVIKPDMVQEGELNISLMIQ